MNKMSNFKHSDDKKTSLIYDKTIKENNFDLQQTTATTELQTADLRQAFII